MPLPAAGIGTASSLLVIPVVLGVLLTFCRMPASAETDTVRVPSDSAPAGGNLNAAVATAAGKLSRTVFVLEPNGYYILRGTISVPAGEHLIIVAPEPGTTQPTAPPQIVHVPEAGPFCESSGPACHLATEK
jgi:hypothetical protein